MCFSDVKYLFLSGLNKKNVRTVMLNLPKLQRSFTFFSAFITCIHVHVHACVCNIKNSTSHACSGPHFLESVSIEFCGNFSILFSARRLLMKCLKPRRQRPDLGKCTAMIGCRVMHNAIPRQHELLINRLDLASSITLFRHDTSKVVIRPCSLPCAGLRTFT